MSSYTLALTGCAPVPLGGYLKALGILRLIAEQADSDATAYWQHDQFFLVSRLDDLALKQFFLNSYRPSPLVAPWGGRSGFFDVSSEKTAREALEEILKSPDARLAAYQRTIMEIRKLLGQLGIESKARDDEKIIFLRACRAQLADDLLPWLDACYSLTEDGRKFPPLLGTGGNEGSGSYVAGFAQQVVNCIVHHKYDHALPAAIFGVPHFDSYTDQTPGHFAPETAGWFNSGAGYGGQVSTNPWDYLLYLEGTLLFAASITRKLEGSQRGELSFPFTVKSSGSGAGNGALTDEANARAEMWLPLWEKPILLPELKLLLGEGRVNLGRRRAYDGLDFVRAVVALGVDRGIKAFQRYAFLQRQGQSYISIPLNRIQVRRNPTADLMDELDRSRWLRCFCNSARSKNASAKLRMLSKHLEDRLFDMARTRTAHPVQRVIITLGAVMQYLSVNSGLQSIVPPLPRLSEGWITAADDASHEFRVAVALAGIHEKSLPMVAHFFPVHPLKTWEWQTGSRLVTFTPGHLIPNLQSILERRLMEATRQNFEDKPLAGWPPADQAAVGAFLGDPALDRRVADLLVGLVSVRMPSQPLSKRNTAAPVPLPAIFHVLKPLFTPNRHLYRTGLLSIDQTLPLPETLPRLLRAGRLTQALEIARRRLRASGLPAPLPTLQAPGVDGARLVAALIMPTLSSKSEAT